MSAHKIGTDVFFLMVYIEIHFSQKKFPSPLQFKYTHEKNVTAFFTKSWQIFYPYEGHSRAKRINASPGEKKLSDLRKLGKE